MNNAKAHSDFVPGDFQLEPLVGMHAYPHVAVSDTVATYLLMLFNTVNNYKILLIRGCAPYFVVLIVLRAAAASAPIAAPSEKAGQKTKP